MMPAQIKDEDNGAAVYVGSSLTMGQSFDSFFFSHIVNKFLLARWLKMLAMLLKVTASFCVANFANNKGEK